MTETADVQRIPPLAWPKEWLHPSDLQKALVGMPFIGLQRRVYRSISAQLLSRGPEYRLAWSRHQVPESTWSHWSHRVREEGLWPGERFTPDDPFAIVFWDRRFDGLVVVELLSELAEFFQTTSKRARWGTLRDATYGVVLARLARGTIKGP